MRDSNGMGMFKNEQTEDCTKDFLIIKVKLMHARERQIKMEAAGC